MKKLKLDFSVLDGLRGIAALYVVINHCRGNMLIGGNELSEIIPISDWTFGTKLYYALLQITSLGTEFVILFFVLSGFSIAHSLKAKTSIPSFYFRRFIRLYWPYLIALFWAYFVFELIARNSNLFNLNQSVFYDWSATLKNLGYIPNGDLIPQFWSLTYEVLFYFIAPLILLHKKANKIILLVFLFLFIVGLFFNPTTIVSKFFFSYGIYFFLGIGLYTHFKTSSLFEKIRNKKVLFLSIFILFPFMVLIKYKMGEDNRITPILSAILSIILIINFLHFNIKTKLLTFIGKMSYTLYITHFATIYLTLFLFEKLNLIDSLQIQKWYIWLIGIFVSVLVSVPFYYLGESPTKRLLKKLRKR